jgi:hypothetical protein
MQGGHDIIAGSNGLSSTPNGMQNIGIPLKTYYSMSGNNQNGGGMPKNFGDSEEKRRLK